METSKLKKFAQYARRYLIEQVSAKLKFVVAADSLARRENPKAVQELEKQIQATSLDRVIEKVAYIWFNRFCALRFMDVNRFTSTGIVSPTAGQFQPEILADAKMGHIDEAMVPDKTQQQVFALLGGSAPSRDPQQEAYSLLVVAVCNYFNFIMPFMFEKIADYTELLMPDDLLSGNSILAYIREAMTPDICKDVEVIGWLYQFYISEKKDEVFEGLKKNKKITPENIPAATQLFTPHWIVRYLVENSLGRLWMLNRPNSRLIERVDYYVKPEVPEIDFLRISKPEEIKLCDPACGSGHMLTYSFDLLYAIYEEEGYDVNEIPRLILENNLFGIEIDERAGELAAFALTMKARDKYKRFLNKPVQPNICVLQNIHFEEGELKRYTAAVGRDLFTANLQTLLHQFRELDNFGSLIRPEFADAEAILRIVEQKKLTSDLFLRNTHERVLLALKQADYLSPKYHVVVANPPYMGSKGMNDRLKVLAQENYSDGKSDLFAMFIERGLEMVLKQGYSAMVTMQSWMFLSSYEKLRERLLSEVTIDCMVHMSNMVMGIAFGTSATIWNKVKKIDYKGHFSYVYYEDLTSANKPKQFPMNNGRLAYASAADFKKIPGSPIAYWVSKSIRSLFNHPKLGEICETRLGMATANNDLFLRFWHEVSECGFSTGIISRKSAEESKLRWFPYQKGGEYRKWYGNLEFLVNWERDGYEIRNFGNVETGKVRSHNYNLDYIFKEGVTWNALTSAKTSARISRNSLFDNAGSSLFASDSKLHCIILSYINSNLIVELISLISPTLNYQPGDIAKLPAFFDIQGKQDLCDNANSLIKIASTDWDFYEISWDFTRNPLLHSDYRQPTLMGTYFSLRAKWREMTIEMQRLEEENNRIFIEAYDLREAMRRDVPLNEITLTCNPHYRYGGDKSEEEMEAILLADTMKEFISYAVGCMFGRYSIDKPGLILANQGETVKDYIAKVPNHTIVPAEDNVVPILDEGWFIDDITEQFNKFLKVTFSEQYYDENLRFIVDALNIKNKKNYSIREYFVSEFYPDHLKRYKKRPIYWLFSSPKGCFNALIYMHRYRPDTVSVVLNDYLREFRTKLSARKGNLEQISISASAAQRDKIQALKDIEKLSKMIEELEKYEREIMYPLATKQISIDLDEGVKVNYLKFGDALKKVPGLEAREEE